MQNCKHTFQLLFLATALLIPSLSFAQYDWNPSTGSYGQYWNDYTSPVWTPTIPSTGNESSSTGSNSTEGSSTSIGSGTSSGTSGTRCRNFNSILKLKEPPYGFGVKANKDGKLYYFGGSDEVKNVRLDQSSHKIYAQKTVDGSPEELEVGEITVFDPEKCSYPEYGYVFTNKMREFLDTGTSNTPSTSGTSSNTGSEETPLTGDLKVPADKTAVTVDAKTGEVFDFCTKKIIDTAKYDKNNIHKLYYHDNRNSSFGTMLSETFGYVNINVIGIGKVNSSCLDETRSPGPGFTEEPKASPGPGFEPNPEASPGPGFLESFKDVKESAPYAPAITFAVSRNWIDEAEKFYPSRSIKQCEAAQLLIRALDIQPFTPEEGATFFADVSADSEYAPYVYAGARLGFWAAPKSETSKFGCSKKLTRGKLALILSKVFDLKDTAGYKPKDKTPTAYNEAIAKVHAAGLMKGLGKSESKFGAIRPVKRADAVKILAEAFGLGDN